MAALTCEICGGKLIGRPGGIFECDSCGMEYDTAWAKSKIQEIKGTVKVEGTVQVQGSVKVDGPVEVKGGVNKGNLLERGYLALEDWDWDEAEKFFDEALNYDPKCAEAYLGKLMSSLRVCKREALKDCERPFDNWEDYQKIMRFGSEELKVELTGYVEYIRLRNKQAAYNTAKDAMERATTAEAYREAAKLFEKLGDFKDAAVLLL